MNKKRTLLAGLLLFFSLFVFTGKNADAATKEKFVTTINVTSKKYGAKSGTDSTKAIQKALDDAAAKATAKKRAKVVIPKGTYYLSKTLRIDSNVYLLCDDKTVITKKSKSCLWLIASKDNKKGKYNGVKNITIEGGTWDAKYIKYNSKSSGSLLYFVHGQNLEFKNMTIKRNYGTHLIELGAVKNVTISGCTLYGFKKNSGEGDKEAIQLDIAHSDAVLPGAAPYDDTPCKNVTIENNEIYNYPRAIGTHAAADKIYYDNIVIRNNNIHDISEEAIYVYNYTNLTVENNQMTNVGCGIVFKTFTKGMSTMFNRLKNVKAMSLPNNDYNLVIRGNTIKTTSKSSSDGSARLGIYIYGSSKYRITGCVIEDNVIQSRNTGIVLKYATNNTISNNTITSTQESGIHILDKSSATLTSNTVKKAKKYGIFVNNASAVIKGCKIKNTTQNGILVAQKSSAKITSTTITNSKKTAINVNNSYANINKCTVTGSSEIGIWVRSTTKDSVISNCTIKDNAQNGIKVADAVITVTGNTVSGNGVNGIALYTSTVKAVSGNKLNNPKSRYELSLSSCKAPSGLSNIESISTTGTFEDKFENQVTIDI